MLFSRYTEELNLFAATPYAFLYKTISPLSPSTKSGARLSIFTEYCPFFVWDGVPLSTTERLIFHDPDETFTGILKVAVVPFFSIITVEVVPVEVMALMPSLCATDPSRRQLLPERNMSSSYLICFETVVYVESVY